LDKIEENMPVGVAIIDPVGMKAGMDQYDLNLARSLNKLSCRVKVYSNFSDEKSNSIVEEHFTFEE
jgi:hypothetical protein